jgi:hypothetical protein
MIGIAEGYGDKDKPAGRQQVGAVVGQPIGLDDMLEQVAEQCPRVERPESDHVGVLSQIGLNIDPGQFALIDVDDLDAADSQGPEQLLLDPRLHELADIGRAAAEIEKRRQPLGRESIQRAAEPASLGLEHRGLARSAKTYHDAPTLYRSESDMRSTRTCVLGFAATRYYDSVPPMGGNLPLRSTFLLHRTQQCSDRVD